MRQLAPATAHDVLPQRPLRVGRGVRDRRRCCESPARALPVVVMAAGVAYGRVHIGVHYPSDVVAGVALGAGICGRRDDESGRRGRLPPVPRRLPAAKRRRSRTATASSSSSTPAPSRPVTLPTSCAAQVSDAAAQGRSRAVRGARPHRGNAAGCSWSSARARRGRWRRHRVLRRRHRARCMSLPLAVLPAGTLNHFAGELGVDDVGDCAEGGGRRIGRVDQHRLRPARACRFSTRSRSGSIRSWCSGGSSGRRSSASGPRSRWRWWRCSAARSPPHRSRREAAPGMAAVRWQRPLPPVGLRTVVARSDSTRMSSTSASSTRSAAGRERGCVAAVLTGRLGRCRVYEERVVEKLTIRFLDPDPALARDGETQPAPTQLTLRPSDHRLVVYRQ